MPCYHIFRDELNLEHIDYEPETLVAGSFSPAIDANPATWFYGRTDADFLWDILPRLYGEASMNSATADEWRQFSRAKKIAFIDLIDTIEDADPAKRAHYKILAGFSDKAIAYHFDDYLFTDIPAILKKRPSIQHVYITRGITEAFWRHLWNPVMHYCNRNGIYERRLLTPGPESAYHLEAYNRDHPGNEIHSLPDYVLMRWREEWKF